MAQHVFCMQYDASVETAQRLKTSYCYLKGQKLIESLLRNAYSSNFSLASKNGKVFIFNEHIIMPAPQFFRMLRDSKNKVDMLYKLDCKTPLELYHKLQKMSGINYIAIGGFIISPVPGCKIKFEFSSRNQIIKLREIECVFM